MAETFILTVPEEGGRRIDLVRATFTELGNLHPDAVWELIRASPFAAFAAGARQTERHFPLSLSIAFGDSPLAAAVLFDPANGFSDDYIARYFRHGANNVVNARRILDEWIGGRWPGDPPECIRSAWLSLGHLDKEALSEIRAKLPETFQEAAGRFDAYDRLADYEGPITTDPDAAALLILGPGELAEFVDERAMAARPIPLAILAELPPELRKPAIEDYFNWLYPFHAGLAKQTIEELDRYGLSDSEKQSLLISAASYECNAHGDYETALDWTGRIADERVREETKREMLEEWAQQDPHSALEYAIQLPPGELRDDIERQAREGMP